MCGIMLGFTLVVISYLIGYASGYMRNYHEITRLDDKIINMEIHCGRKEKNRHG